jgi:hypothetical protein
MKRPASVKDEPIFNLVLDQAIGFHDLVNRALTRNKRLTWISRGILVSPSGDKVVECFQFELGNDCYASIEIVVTRNTPF